MDLKLTLPDELVAFVEGKVANGPYASTSDVVRDALRLMEELERHDAENLQILSQAWQAGLDSGDAGELDFAVLKREARARLAALRL